MAWRVCSLLPKVSAVLSRIFKERSQEPEFRSQEKEIHQRDLRNLRFRAVCLRIPPSPCTKMVAALRPLPHSQPSTQHSILNSDALDTSAATRCLSNSSFLTQM